MVQANLGAAVLLGLLGVEPARPGSKVHASGVPWQDDSGDHLLKWLQVDRVTFEDPDAFAILPMGFCWPGRRAGGDLPPRPECAPAWHGRLLSLLPRLELYLPTWIPLPHPSWRSRLWMKKNPWFERRLLPALQRRVGEVLGR